MVLAPPLAVLFLCSFSFFLSHLHLPLSFPLRDCVSAAGQLCLQREVVSAWTEATLRKNPLHCPPGERAVAPTHTWKVAGGLSLDRELFKCDRWFLIPTWLFFFFFGCCTGLCCVSEGRGNTYFSTQITTLLVDSVCVCVKADAGKKGPECVCEVEIKARRPHMLIWSTWSDLILACVL